MAMTAPSSVASRGRPGRRSGWFPRRRRVGTPVFRVQTISEPPVRVGSIPAATMRQSAGSGAGGQGGDPRATPSPEPEVSRLHHPQAWISRRATVPPRVERGRRAGLRVHGGERLPIDLRRVLQIGNAAAISASPQVISDRSVFGPWGDPHGDRGGGGDHARARDHGLPVAVVVAVIMAMPMVMAMVMMAVARAHDRGHDSCLWSCP